MFSADRLPVYTIASLYWRCLLCLASVYLHELCCLLLDAMSSDHPNEVFALFARTFSISRTVLCGVPRGLERSPFWPSRFARTLSPALFSIYLRFIGNIGRQTATRIHDQNLNTRYCTMNIVDGSLLTLKLQLFLAVLELGAPLSGFLEEALYSRWTKWLKKWINEWKWTSASLNRPTLNTLFQVSNAIFLFSNLTKTVTRHWTEERTTVAFIRLILKMTNIYNCHGWLNSIHQRQFST